MTTKTHIRLKKGEDRRIRSGHPWIYSNEIDTKATPLKAFTPGQEVLVEAHDKSIVGVAYVNPHSLIAARIFSYQPDERLDESFFVKRIKKALNLRTRLFDKPFYRLIFSEADGLPGLIVDRFDDDLAVQINTAGMELKREVIGQALLSVLSDTQSILLRNDSQIREQEGLDVYVRALHGSAPTELILEENEASFAIPFQTGQKTGWFYDHRMNRARLKSYVVNKTVLDVFSYLGGWGITAASYGAKSVDCVEVSKPAAEYIRKNAELNHVQDKVNVISEDAFDALKALLQSGNHYDVIILDPPAFVKKLKDRKEGLIAYQRINELAVKLLSDDGILVTCSCSMHVSMEDLILMLQRVSYRTQTPLQILERGHQGPDHPIHPMIPETDYLKALIVRKM